MAVKDYLDWVEADWDLLPEHIQGAVKRYIELGIPPGGFLEAVASNDLTGALSRADDVNREHIGNIVQFFWWHVPSEAWGSPEAVDRWIEKGGLNGKR